MVTAIGFSRDLFEIESEKLRMKIYELKFVDYN